jgi:hypothetical protein
MAAIPSVEEVKRQRSEVSICLPGGGGLTAIAILRVGWLFGEQPLPTNLERWTLDLWDDTEVVPPLVRPKSYSENHGRKPELCSS